MGIYCQELLSINNLYPRRRSNYTNLNIFFYVNLKRWSKNIILILCKTYLKRLIFFKTQIYFNFAIENLLELNYFNLKKK